MKKVNFRYIPCLFTIPVSILAASLASAQPGGIPGSIAMYQENCAVCHGENLEGAAQGRPLRGELLHGDSVSEIAASISRGYESSGMPSWQRSLSDVQIRNLALYIAEARINVDYQTFNYDAPLIIPDDVIATELHSFRIETVASDLAAAPFSIAPLPDGRLLLTEKKIGVSIIGLDGKQSALIRGTPQAYDDSFILSMDQERGWGWIFDIALHPDYQENGWIYLSYSDRCERCNALSRAADSPVSMIKLIRGRIEDGAWIDQQTIWEADLEHYGNQTDLAAGGRIAFDDGGHVFFSVGVKGVDVSYGIQDLEFPWGKIHRINDDGSIPADNPFADRDNVYRSIYTIGHRSPGGLEFDTQGGGLWGTEHGPRGGDEVNLLLPGGNYGWPLTSLGMNYNGTPVNHGDELNIAFELADIQQPIVDLTPSPAVSSFIISSSEKFPEWNGDFLVGSLKARSLYRFQIRNNVLVSRETLLQDLARIRDIEQGFNGEIYLLLEHNSGSRIVRLVPEDQISEQKSVSQ
jgi:aldose sugar dehydrogenase